MSTELGKLLRELRGKKSLREAAELTGLSHPYIRVIEKGGGSSTKFPTQPSADTLKKFAAAYNYPYSDLVEVAGYITNPISAELQVFESQGSDILAAIQELLNSGRKFRIVIQVDKE